MKKRLVVILAVLIIVIVIGSAFAALEVSKPPELTGLPKRPTEPFYLGVTYCGDNVTEAKQLVDRVKNFTNLFIVDSGPLMDNLTGLNQICNYSVAAGLNIIVYFAPNITSVNVPFFIGNATANWGSHFLGVYYDDEPGGKMLDGNVNLYISGERIPAK